MAQLVGVAETLTAEGADFVQSEQQQGDNECRVIPVLIKRDIYIYPIQRYWSLFPGL